MYKTKFFFLVKSIIFIHLLFNVPFRKMGLVPDLESKRNRKKNVCTMYVRALEQKLN